MAQQIYRIGNMDCAHCAQEVQEGVRTLQGVTAVRVDFATTKMVVEGQVAFDALKTRVEALGKTLHTTEQPTPTRRGGVVGFGDYLLQRRDTQFALLGGALLLVGALVSWLLLGQIVGLAEVAPSFNQALVSAIYITAMLVALFPIAQSGVKSLRVNRIFNINLLMTIAAVGAVLIGEYLEGALVIFLFAIGEALEGYTADRARQSLRSLLSLKPTEALLLLGDLTLATPVDALKVDDLILVKGGERVPMDGEVVRGESSVDQSPITGESLPQYKTVGDTVFAGTLNGNGSLTIRVTHLVADNTLSRIIQLVEDAQDKRAQSHRLIDEFAKYYTPAVTIIALLVAILPPLLLNAPFFNTATEHGWLYRAINMLVIACPCALVISTPVTIISAITGAARHGVLIKGGAYLEALGRVRAIAFDKTGTLTVGKPSIQHIVAQTGTEDDLLRLMASLEAHSTHPLAQAILDASHARQLVYGQAENVEVLAGRGLTGMVDQQTVVIGSHAYFDGAYPHDAELCEAIHQREQAGYSTLLVHSGETVLGFVAVSDVIRADSAGVVRQLNDLGLETILCTGDNAIVANNVAQQVGLSDVRANLLPQDKVTAIQELRTRFQSVAMVGDGINDTPALASATVGIAMGGAGSAQALETADVVLMADDLKQLPYAIRLSRFSRRLIWGNILLALSLKVVFLSLAVFGQTSLWMAIFADVGMSLIVTLNGMRPLRFK